MLWIEGPAGIGKSRLVDEARELSHVAGLQVLSARAGELEREQQVLAIIADRRLPSDRQADVLQLLRNVAEVGVEYLAGEHLVAGADHFDAHA